MVNYNGLRQYRDIGAKSAVEEATPHRLVQMLMEGALARIAAAGGHLMRREVAKKGESIGHAISIIGGLQASLDHDKGGDIATNLDRLYDYMVRRLTEANIENDGAKLQEVHRLLNDIKGAWDLVPEKLGQQQSGGDAESAARDANVSP